MVNKGDKTADADHNAKAASVNDNVGHEDDSTSESDDQARLSQSLWARPDTATGAKTQDAQTPEAKIQDAQTPEAKTQDPKPQTAAATELEFTPIQSVLTPPADTAKAPAEQQQGDAAQAEQERPVAAPTDVAQATPKDERPPEAKDNPAPPTKLEAAPGTSLEQLRKAVEDADKQAPLALKALTQGRDATLDFVRGFVATDAKSADGDQAITNLKAQELQQSKDYIEYLKPGTTRADLATALIAKGDDASVREGEQKLVEAVQSRPDLIFHPNFRAQVMDAYNKMAQTRRDSGMEPWKADIDLTKFLSKGTADRSRWSDTTGPAFEQANNTYFDKGAKAALPEFNAAIKTADGIAEHNKPLIEDERLKLFVEGLKTDRAIAQGQVSGDSTTELEKRRVAIWQKQVDNYVEDSVGSRARMNVGLALVASGDAEMLAQGKQNLLDAVAKHPGLIYSPGLASFSNEFTERMFGAFKAGAENAPANAEPKPATTDGAPTPSAKEQVESGYDKTSITNAPLPDSNTDKKVEGYGWDKATDIGLPIATLGLMLYTGRRQYNNWQRAKAAREASFDIEPTERSATQKDVVTRKGTNGDEKFEIKGRAKDGQIVAKNVTEGADATTNSKPPIDLPGDFNPAKNKFGEYQPVRVDGQKYFLNKNGEAFEHRQGKLYPTEAVRGLKPQEVAAQELKPLPNDMQRTTFDLHGRSLTPLGALPDGRIILQNNTTGGSPMRDMIQVPEGVDPLKGELKDFQHQRLAGRDYFISADNKVYTMLQPERKMMEVEGVVVKPADAVYKATGAPGSTTEERALNKQVNDILEPLRSRLRTGEFVDAATKADYLNRARDVLMPAAKAAAKAQGLPESVISDRNFRFGIIDGSAEHNARTGDITLSIDGDSHITAIDHEVSHKKRALDMIAAVEADPKGFRDAILDRSLNDIGRQSRRFTDTGVDTRPAIENPKAVEALKEQVRTEVLSKLAERGDIPFSQVPAAKELPKELLDTFGGNADRVKLEVQREAQNFLSLEKQNTWPRTDLDKASQEHVDKRVAEFKDWQSKGTTDGTTPSLRNNPELKTAIDGVAIDTLATHHRADPSLRPYYRFSSDEIAARKQQASQAMERLSAELKAEGKTLADNPEGRKLTERALIADLQQKVLTDLQTGNSAKAKEQAAELLQRMSSSEPARYVEDVRFMQERNLLSTEQISKTKFGELLKAPRPESTQVLSGLRDRISAMDEFNTESGDKTSRLTWDSLVQSRGEILGSAKFKADPGQKNVYDLLQDKRPEVGILKRLKDSGQISGSWDIFPSEPGSAADKIGADYLLVNKETGDVHFLDATRNPNKDNVYRLRQDGVILYENSHFEKGSGFVKITGKGETPTEFELAAKDFRADIESQIKYLTTQEAAFNLKTTPIPDVVADKSPQSAVKTKEQVDRFLDWAREEARRTGDPHGDFRDMITTLEKGASQFTTFQAREVKTPEFDRAVRNRTSREIARYLAAQVSQNQRYTPRLEEKSGGESDVRVHEQQMKFTEGDTIHVTSSPMDQIYSEQIGKFKREPIKLITTLSKQEIIALNPNLFGKPPFEGKSADKLRAEIEKSYTENPRGPVGKVVERLTGALYDKSGVIINGGAEGTGPRVLEQTIVGGLRGQKADNILERKAPAKPEKPVTPPAEVFAKALPKASVDLRNTLDGLVADKSKLGATADATITEWMKEMANDPAMTEKWGPKELESFKAVAEKYAAGDAATIQQVHEYLKSTEGTTTGDAAVKDRKSELAETPAVEVPRVPSPVGNERMGNYRDLLAGLNNLTHDQFINEAMRKAQSALTPDVSRPSRLAFMQTSVGAVETEGLKPGESELVVKKGNDAHKVVSYDAAKSEFVTTDGTRIAAKDAKVEVRLGKGTTNVQAAREALTRTHELAALMSGTAKQGQQAQAELNAIRTAFDGTKVAGSGDLAGSHVADKVLTLGEFEFQNRRQTVELTNAGVKFGGKETRPYEQLVQETLRDKRSELDRLEKERERAKATDVTELQERINVLKQQTADLEQLAKDVHKPESVAKLMEAIREKATPEEIAKLRQEQGKPGGRLKGAIVRGGSYALVAVFVASMLAGSSSSDATTPQYAPTTVR